MNLSEWTKLMGFNPAKILTIRELEYMLADDWLYFDCEMRKRINKVPVGIGLAICKISRELAWNNNPVRKDMKDFNRSERDIVRDYDSFVADESL